MKRTIITIALSLILCVLFLSCEFGVTASIPVSLPDTVPFAAEKSVSFNSRASTRAIDDSTWNFARIYLISNAGFVFLGEDTGTVYVDVDYAEREYTIENVRSTYTYDLIVAFYDNDAAIMGYAYKDDMIVKDGKDNRFTLTIHETVFQWEVADWTEVDSVVSFDDSLAWLEKPLDSSLTELWVETGDAQYEIALGAGTDANSINLGKSFAGGEIQDELWVNTNRGIIPFDNVVNSTTYDTYNLSAGLNADGDVNVGESFAIPLEDVVVEDDQGNESTIAPVIVIAYQDALYQGSGSFGGVVLDEETAIEDADWYTKTEILDEASEGGTDLDTIIGDLDVVLLDHVLDGTNLYASTALSILPLLDLTSSIVEDFEEIFDTEDDVNINDVIDTISPITITDSGGIVLSVNSIVLSGNSSIFFGTEKGIYKAALDSEGKIVENTIALLAGTGTKIINNMEISTANADNIIAVQTPTSLMLLEEDGDIIDTYEFFMGLPGMISDIEWQGKKLYISGTMGLVSKQF